MLRRRRRAHRPVSRRRQRGMTLIEVLVSFFILFVVTLAVLELFSLSVAVNLGSAARTEMSFKAQLVAETVRLQRFYDAPQNFAGRNATCCPLTDGTVALPPERVRELLGAGGGQRLACRRAVRPRVSDFDVRRSPPGDGDGLPDDDGLDAVSGRRNHEQGGALCRSALIAPSVASC